MYFHSLFTVQVVGQVLPAWMCSLHCSLWDGMAIGSSALKERLVPASSCQFLLAPPWACHLGFRGGTRGRKAHMSELWLLDLSPLQENYLYLKEQLSEVCSRHGERVLDTPHNPISLGG